MVIKNVELLNSYFSGFSAEEKIIILTLVLINFCEKEGYTNEQIEWFFIQAKADFLRFKDSKP